MKPPRIWPVALAYFLYWPVSLGTFIILAAVTTFRALRSYGDSLPPDALGNIVERSLSSPASVLIGAAMSGTYLLAAALAGAGLSQARLADRLGLHPTPWRGWRRAAGYALAFAFAFATGLATSGLALELAGGQSAWLQELAQTVAAGAGVQGAATMFCVAFLAPVSEELFFRGYVQTRLVARFGRVAGIVATALLFAIMHIDPMQASFALAIGLAAGWMRDRSGSIRPALVAHLGNNLLYVAAARAGAIDQGPQPAQWATIVVFSTIAFAAAVGFARLTPRSTSEPPPGAPAG